MPSISTIQARWFRLRRSGLVEPLASPEVATAQLAGVQAQILPAAALALWNRSAGLTYAQFEHLLYEQRSLVKLWGQRHTLHLYPSLEWPLIYAALTERKTWWERKFEADSPDRVRYERTIDQITVLLRQRESLGRSDLRQADLELADGYLSAWGGIFSGLVGRGIACHARPNGGEGRFVHRETWLPNLLWQPPDFHSANLELTQRFFYTYGPATVPDLNYWRGALARQARPWIKALADELVEVELDGRSMLALQADLDDLQATPPPLESWPTRLLYRFDPLLLAHKDKTWLVEPAYYKRVWRPAGHIEGTILAHGQLTGTWRYDRKGRGLVISVYPFEPLPAEVSQTVADQAEAIARFFELPLIDLMVEA